MKNKHRGVSMIEVMVAVLVLAIGLLGVAGMQTVSMQQTQGADRRSVASLHLQTIADEIRSERGFSAGDVANWKRALNNDLGGSADLTITENTVGTYREATLVASWESRGTRWDQVGDGDSPNLSEQTFRLIVRYVR
ncbi:type IV pilus modification protein PilV [Methylophaga sp.]|uniref:type IV pilus modification protein PilV n=1 Tax=Methylophaga sp. TaxID=2024840 RepID=UPI003A937E9F